MARALQQALAAGREARRREREQLVDEARVHMGLVLAVAGLVGIGLRRLRDRRASGRPGRVPAGRTVDARFP